MQQGPAQTLKEIWLDKSNTKKIWANCFGSTRWYLCFKFEGECRSKEIW